MDEAFEAWAEANQMYSHAMTIHLMRLSERVDSLHTLSFAEVFVGCLLWGGLSWCITVWAGSRGP